VGEDWPLATLTAKAFRARHLIADCRFDALSSPCGLRGYAHHFPFFFAFFAPTFALAAAAFLARAVRCSGVIAAAAAGPPSLPPSRPGLAEELFLDLSELLTG
jgi:hypothetical protein